jgi:glycosyltransferase involved in cell wall biosynthesis
MKIAIVSEVAPGTWGGVSTVLSYQLQHLIKLHFDIAFIGPQSEQALPEVFLNNDFPRHFTSAFQLPLYQKTNLSLRLDRASRKLLKDFQPDLVHLIDPWFIGRQAALWAKKHSIPVISSFHTDVMAIAPHFNRFFPKRLAWSLCRRAHHYAEITLVPTQVMKQRLKQNKFENVSCWGRGVDTNIFSPYNRSTELRDRLLGKDNEHIILFAGRVSNDKNIEFLLDALVDYQGIRFVVAGNGPSFKQMRSSYASRGVIFTGYLNSKELSCYYASADVLVFASQTDTYGQVLNEAIASGLPVIAAENPVVREVLAEAGDDNFYPPGDADALRNKVHDILENKEKKEKLRSIGLNIANRRSWSVSIKQLTNSYKMIVNE